MRFGPFRIKLIRTFKFYKIHIMPIAGFSNLRFNFSKIPVTHGKPVVVWATSHPLLSRWWYEYCLDVWGFKGFASIPVNTIPMYRHQTGPVHVFGCLQALMNISYFVIVNDYVGFGFMDASKMIDAAIRWTRVPPKVNCSIPRRGINE